MNCITVTLRGAKSLHLCYPNRETAGHALKELDRDISGAPDGYLIVVSKDDRRRIAFLKRDFRSVELSESDEGGDELPQEEPEAQEPLIPLSPTKIEDALAELVSAPVQPH